jgi:integrase
VAQDGSITKRKLKDGSLRYDVVVDLGPDPVTGKRRQRKQTFKTKREAVAFKTARLAEINQGVAVDRSPQTVAQMMEYWLDTYARPNTRPATLEGYTLTVRVHINPVLGAIPVQKLTPDVLEKFYADKLAAGCGARTIQLCHLHISQALKQAMRLGLVSRNVADQVTPPRWTRREMSVWTLDEARRFLAVADQSHHGPIWALALATGMRRGELLGLRWQDVDWERGTVSVRQTVTVLKGAAHIGPPKTKSARRTITVEPPEVLDALKEHRRAQYERRLAVGPGWQQHDLVFSTGIGTPINPGNLDRDFYRLVGRASVPRIRIHDLRHTNVTLTLRETSDIKAVSQRVGHANVSITLGTYAHVLPDQHQEVAKKVGRALFGPCAQDVV